ncbi:Uncharacterized protein SCF082_LOCUS31051 [Durusdinium trenchii]|uniref:Uncharacterized protein n=1 Tax=Durusdinium trenchii TaxID=1381693 RepID=A0ABP0N7B9_9DINO
MGLMVAEGVARGAERMLENADGFVIRDTNGTFVSPIDGEYSDMLYAAAGQSSTAAAILLTIWVGSWMVFPVMYLQVTKVFEFRGIRSEVFFYTLFGMGFPIFVLASGVLVGRDLFVWLKLISVMGGNIAMMQVKYLMPPANRLVHMPVVGELRMSKVFSGLIHTVLAANIIEAVLWEATQLQGQAYNFINAASGAAQIVTIAFTSKRFGVGINEKNNEKERHLQSNLTPIFILCYTMWNMEYNATYHPEKAFYYIIVSLMVPLLLAVLGSFDWLEARGAILCHSLVLRLMPLSLAGPVNACLFIFFDAFVSEYLRYTWSIISGLLAIAMIYETIFRINMGKPHYSFWWSSNIEVDERHPAVYYRDGDDKNDRNSKIMLSDL